MQKAALKSLHTRIRKEMSDLRAGPQRRYSPELRQRIGQYAAGRMAQGVSRARAAKEVGVSDPTLARILSNRRGALRSVRVTEDPAPPPAAVVRGPGGLIIEGLDVDGIAALVRALS